MSDTAARNASWHETWRTRLGPDGAPVVDAPPAQAEASKPPPRSGLVLPERYVDLGAFAEGGVGEIRRVRDRKLDTALVMKLQRKRVGGVQRRRFVREARLTARLHHPNIVPALDLGELTDGKPWFTMPEVRGRTLRAWMDGEGGPRMALRELLEQVEGIARALAYMHSEGVVHRDLKPHNLMVGRFGDVRIMDFGVALDLSNPDEELDDAVVGTPLYMAPEQARGEIDRCSGALDVYALGILLYEALTGSLPYDGTAIQVWHAIVEGPPRDPLQCVQPGYDPPDVLVDLVRAMIRRAPEERPDALGVANRLQAWLSGELRRERALGLVQEAEPLAHQIDTLRQRIDRQRALAAQILADLPPHAPVEDKEPGWLIEDQAAETEVELRRVEARRLYTLQTALHQDPECGPAHRALAAHHREALEASEAAHDPVQTAVHRDLLLAHDRGEFASYLEGKAAVTLHTDPPGAQVVAERLVHKARRWQVAESVPLGTTPLDAVALPHGYWRLRVRAEGRVPVVYPVFMGRGEHWDGVPPDSDEPFPIVLPAALGSGEVYVPAGWYRTGNADEALEPYQEGRVWIDGFFMQRHPVTVGEYKKYLDDCGRDADHVPAMKRDFDRWQWSDIGWSVVTPGIGDEWPVTCIGRDAMLAYLAWRSRLDGLQFRLPHDLEWEKACRGPARSAFPWGDAFDPALCNVLNSVTKPRRTSVDAFGADCSVYGVYGMGGNSRELTYTAWEKHVAPPDRLVVRAPELDRMWVVRGGGGRAGDPPNAHGATRFVTAGQPSDARGFRLVRPLNPGCS
jgi:serine/threonine-protein kinase